MALFVLIFTFAISGYSQFDPLENLDKSPEKPKTIFKLETEDISGKIAQEYGNGRGYTIYQLLRHLLDFFIIIRIFKRI